MVVVVVALSYCCLFCCCAWALLLWLLSRFCCGSCVSAIVILALSTSLSWLLLLLLLFASVCCSTHVDSPCSFVPCCYVQRKQWRLRLRWDPQGSTLPSKLAGRHFEGERTGASSECIRTQDVLCRHWSSCSWLGLCKLHSYCLMKSCFTSFLDVSVRAFESGSASEPNRANRIARFEEN